MGDWAFLEILVCHISWQQLLQIILHSMSRLISKKFLCWRESEARLVNCIKRKALYMTQLWCLLGLIQRYSSRKALHEGSSLKQYRSKRGDNKKIHLLLPVGARTLGRIIMSPWGQGVFDEEGNDTIMERKNDAKEKEGRRRKNTPRNSNTMLIVLYGY